MLKTDQEYRSQIKQVGKYNLKDTHKWRERAIFFNENGYYTDLIEDTKDWDDFWDEEERRIQEGLWIDGFYIPGLYYFYLNYLPIYRKQDNAYDFPDIYDMDYHTFLCLEHAVFLKLDFVVMKKRQAGFSLKFCAPLVRELFFSRGSPNYIATYEEAQVLKAWTEIIEPYREHINAHTPWYRDFNPSKPLNWRAAKEVIDEHGRKLIRGRKNTLKGLVLSKSASKGVGGGATWIFGDECFGKDTPVLMSDYSVKKIQDIKKGEFVLGIDGQPKEVINTCSGIDQMYEIQQRKGLTFLVNSKHKLVLEKRNHRSDNGIKYLTPEEYLNLDKYSLRTHYGIKNQIINYTKINHLITSFKIQPKGLGEYYGIEIKGDSKLFLLEDFTVVHNCGVNPVLSKFKGYINSMMSYGNVKTGTVIFSGAVGELKDLEAGLKDYMVDPEKHGFYAIDNIFDKDNEFAGRKCGFFVPESWAYFGVDDDPESEYYGQPFIDEHGNSFIERAEEYIKKLRLGLIPGKPKVADKFDISQAPLTLAECFQYRGDNVFPLELLQPQIEKVDRRELHGVYVDLYETSSKEIKHKILDKYTYKPILEHPIDPTTKDKDGVIQVWEFPPPNKASYGVYWAGVDIVRDSISVNSPSLNVIHIYKGSHNMESEYKEKIIVAKYMGRPKDKMDWFKKAIMLMEWYNAEALVENNVNWFIEEAIKIQKQHKIAKTPQWVKDMTPQGTSYLTKPYGVVMTPKLMEKILDSIAKYLKEPLHTEYNEETGEPTVHYGVERINDLQLLRELVNYRPKKEYEKGNYDSLISTGLALLQAEYNEVRGIIPKDTKENTNFNQKSAKLMLRNRFSHSNLKKLLNANNIQQ